MVASGVASKGLDFNEIQHVIIFSMPKEIEDYVHQIGRTGRSGKTGIATTFVNMNTAEQTLLDLKYLLMEAGQKYDYVVSFSLNELTRYSCRVPPFLTSIEDPRAAQGGSLKGCPVCGGTLLIPVAFCRRRSFTRLLQVLDMGFPIAQNSRMPLGEQWRPCVLRKMVEAVIDEKLSLLCALYLLSLYFSTQLCGMPNSRGLGTGNRPQRY